MIDFNHSNSGPKKPKRTTPSGHQTATSSSRMKDKRQQVDAALKQNVTSVLQALFPAGKIQKSGFVMGNTAGDAGRSLEVVIRGERIGLWIDRASGDGGDLFDLIAAHHGLSAKRDFSKVLSIAADLVHVSLEDESPTPARSPTATTKSQKTIDNLGSPTAQWRYLDASGDLIAVVYRYDLPDGSKEFRPWDVKRKKHTFPASRPLFNGPALASAEKVIFVEGEKCADALNERGFVATTLMQGANAPVDKTDWTPLKDKVIIIWPDRDAPGWQYAERVGQAALRGGAKSVCILMPPDHKPKGWDVADAIAESSLGDAVFDIAGFIDSGPRISIQLESEAQIIDLLDEFEWETEDGLALAFTGHWGEDWKYCSEWSRWYNWDGTRWNHDRVLYLQHLVREMCRNASNKAEQSKQMQRLASANSMSSVERVIRCDPVHAVATDQWDSHIWLLNTPGGVLDLIKGEMLAHRRDDLMTKITTATPAGPCPTWSRFLFEICGQDKELVSYLQRVVGYCLSGATTEHAIFFLYGTGANGKSVFTNVVTTILGDYAVSAPLETFMDTKHERHPTELAGLRGARLVCSIETEQGRRWNESKLKALTGGDKITARFMRQDYFEFTPNFKLVVAGNHKPSIRNVDAAMKRRLHLIPFTVTIPPHRRDQSLTQKLLVERDGIMRWAFDGFRIWNRSGLNPPKIVTDATNEYFEEEDSLAEFVNEELKQIAEARVSIAALFDRWQSWTTQRGEYTGSSKWLSQQLINRGFERCRITGGQKAIKGLSLKPRDAVSYRTPDD